LDFFWSSVFIYICSTALCGGNAGLVDADTITKTEGQSAIINCQVSFPGKQKFFCKAECKREDVLIATTANSADNHKYSIEYQETSVTSGVLYVVIRQLVKSDTGWYGCGTNSGVINKHVVYLNGTLQHPVPKKPFVHCRWPSFIQNWAFCLLLLPLVTSFTALSYLQ
uniref:Immunoglobulin subtype domain-containing protein n=1 Tax=Monopterus albus TaxID=43700 RepID=A0A3Q3R6T3_MONAL